MPETVVIVDAEPLRRRMTEVVVAQKLGYHAILVASSEEMLARVPAADLVLIDCNPPGNGVQSIRHLKAARPQLPVLALVPYGDEACAVEAVAAGAYDFLTKPIALERLRLSLHNTFKMQRATTQRFPGENAFKDTLALFDLDGRPKSLRSIENEVIRFALKHTSGCMTQAARFLGIGRSTLYRRVGEMMVDGYISRANQTTRPMIKELSIERS